MKITLLRGLAAAVVLAWMPTLLGAESPEGYYRFPAIHQKTIVFAAEGDLWTVDSSGGVARRLTTHPDEEAHPAISPDGETLAFTGAYEGPTELYVMPLTGGRPERLTFDGNPTRYRPQVAGWTPDGRVLFATQARSTLPDTQILRVDPRTGDVEALPLHQAADGAFDPAGETFFFTRQAFQGSHTKRYRGGTAPGIWKLREGGGEAVPLTADFAGTSKAPLFWEGRIYFVTDRDGTLNLWSMAVDGEEVRQHTFHRGWDVLEPDLSAGRVVYRLGADLWIYDIASGEDRELLITLASDFDQERTRWIEDPFEYLTAAHLSPTGDRVVFTARGEVFVAPVGDGRLIHVRRRDDVRYRQARFLPQGDALMVLSDESGEVEWWRLPLSGGAAEQWTDDGKVLRYDGTPSPDGRFLASHNHDREVWLVDTARRASAKMMASVSFGVLGPPTFSPDSRWLAWSLFGPNELGRIYIAQVDERRPLPLTTDRYHSTNPVFSPDGRWIFFLSDRHFESLVPSPWGRRQPDPFFDRQTKIYAVALVPGIRFPFRRSDELHPASRTPTDASQGDPEKVVRVEVTEEGLGERLHEVPVPPGNYSELGTNGRRLFFLRRETSGERRLDLMGLEVGPGKARPQVLAEDLLAYELSADGKKLLLHKRRPGGEGEAVDFFVADASSAAPIDLEKAERVDLSGWRFPLDPREEWRQMFTDAWRLHRDYFYDRGMHGVDWRAQYEKYRPLIDRVTTRSELSDVLAQMVSELSALHTYVRGGDHRKGPEQIEPAFLGAQIERDEDAGGYRVVHIYRADPDLPDQLSPLARPEVGAREGDVILEINGVSTLRERPEALLRDQAGKQVRLRLASASGEAPRDLIVVPIDAARARDLRYDEWEYTRRRTVDERSGERIGYVHLRAMGRDDIAQWQRDFYPIFRREGLIIDVRHNRGGNIDSWILGKLLRRAWFYWQSRSGQPYWNMQQAFRGHLAVIVNEWTLSDGEAFAEGFRRLGLGPVIGTRTWGGEIWLTQSNVLVDKGVATAAEFGVYGPEGEWLIEGHGVVPDIVVDNLPHETYRGKDAQLEAAVEYLLEKIREEPRPVTPVPPFPDLSQD